MMSDANAPLRDALANLHDQLQRTESLDQADRELLEQTLAQVRDKLQGNASKDTPAHASIVERLSDSVRTFEAQHPTLASSVEGVLDLLRQMGI